jgi:ElaB/YqjD/DUF883 family membrane-anchored ribosome-binding protein
MADTMRDNLKNVIDRVVDTSKNVANHAVDATDSVAQGVKNAASTVADKVQQTAPNAVACADKTWHTMTDDVSELVKKYPVASIAICIGIGLLVGRGVSNRS